MRSILIVSSPADLHAVCIAWMLKRKGCSTTFLDTTGHSSSKDYSYFIENGLGASLSLGEASDPNVVWRRRLYPRDMNSAVHPSDQRFVNMELDRFERSVLEAIHHSSTAFWVNAPYGAGLAENKLLQLDVIRKHGGRVPRTLVSRHPGEVRQFVGAHGQVVMKPQVGHFWVRDDRVSHQTKASLIDESMLLDDEPIAVCPMIYQECVDKISDIRVVKMGDQFFGMRMTSSSAGTTEVDHRIGLSNGSLRYEAFDVPNAIKALLNAACSEFGIVYASCDFAQTASGDLVFLDLNPAGQFMFLESFVPEIRIMNCFADFLAGSKSDQELTVAEFEASDEFAHWDAYFSVGHGNAYRPAHILSEEVA